MGVEPPCPENQHYFRDDSGPDECWNTWWRPAKTVADIRSQQKSDVGAESVAANAIAGARRPHGDPHSRREHCELHGERSGNRIPQSKSNPGSTRIERHVRPMRDPVKNPMAHHTDPDRDRARPIASNGVVDE